MATRAKLTKVDRFQVILDLIRDQQRVSLADLEQALDVARVTIQRDLAELDNRGLLRRFHGGAMSSSLSGHLKHHDVRKTQNVTAKKRMARKAARIIRPGMYLGLDGSTSAYYLSECRFPDDVLVVTNNVDTFSRLSRKPGVKTVLTGGWLHPETGTLVGSEAVRTVREFRFDLCFVSAESYHPHTGFVESVRDEVEMKKAFLEGSSKIVMMLDASKIAKTGGIRLCDSEDVHRLVLDGRPARALRKRFEGRLL